MGWLEDAKEKYNERELYDIEKPFRVVIDSQDNIPDVFDGIKEISISSKYEGNPMELLPDLIKSAKSLETLNVYSRMGISWQDMCSLDLSKIKELYFSLEGRPTENTLNAPSLEKLSIYGHLELTPLELMISPVPYIDFSGMQSLVSLTLRHFKQFNPKDCQYLKKLQTLFVSGANISGLSWLKEADYSLETLLIDGSVEDCSGIECQKKLKKLRLSDNYLRFFQPIQQLEHLEELDLRYNDSEGADILRTLGIKRVLITRRDSEIQWIMRKVDDLIPHSIMYLRSQNRQVSQIDKLPRFQQQMLLRAIGKPFETRMKELIYQGFKNDLMEIEKSDHILGTRLITKSEYKDIYIKMAKSYYPFLQSKL